MAIPKVIHYCWFGGAALPESAKLCIESWKKYCPDYKIIEWNESNYDVHKNMFVEKAYNCKKWAFVSDYARLDIIYNHGGIYFDVDVEILKNIDDLLQNRAFVGMEHKFLINTGLGFAAEKNTHIIKEFMEVYELIKEDFEKYFTDIPCPVLQTNVLLEKGFIKKNKQQNIDGLAIYPIEYFCPMNYITGKVKITDNTYSIHHYTASWLDDIIKEKVILKRKISRFTGVFIATKISSFITYKKHFGMKYVMKKIFKFRSNPNE